jgi:hypothetical protein
MERIKPKAFYIQRIRNQHVCENTVLNQRILNTASAYDDLMTKLIFAIQKLVFLVYDTTRDLAILSLMALSMNQSLTELMSD